MALSQQADETMRKRSQRTNEFPMSSGVVRDGEVSSTLTRAWASLVSMQRQQSDEDSEMDVARQLLQLRLIKSEPTPPIAGIGLSEEAAAVLATLPFSRDLFNQPATLSIQLPSPIDMVISLSDLQLYSCINSYLVSLRRAHIRLAELWKLTSLRRHHPAPRGAGDYSYELRERWSYRADALRSTWSTASAAMFFLGETEAYFQLEIVEGLWQSFRTWLGGDDKPKKKPSSRPSTRSSELPFRPASRHSTAQPDDIEMGDSEPTPSQTAAAPSHDQQTLSNGHTLYLRTLCHRLLLTQPVFINHLHSLIGQINLLVDHVRSLHEVFIAADLETDAGVVDSSTDREALEANILNNIRTVERNIKHLTRIVIETLEVLSNDAEFLAEWEGEHLVRQEEDDLSPDEPYRPVRLGGVDRLLMKLDFGSWFGRQPELEPRDGYDDDEEL